MANANTASRHNESLAEFNGAGPTIDAEVHLPKPNIVDAVKANKGLIATVFGIASVLFVGVKLRGDLQEVTEAIAEQEVEVGQQ